MRRALAALATVGITIGVLAPASGAAVVDDDAKRHEALRLRCWIAHPPPPPDQADPANPGNQAGRAGEGTDDAERPPAVSCRWSESHRRDFRAYRLRRAEGAHRTTVFRTARRHTTAYRDKDVEHGERYVYWVQVVGPNGRIVGWSRPVPVRVP